MVTLKECAALVLFCGENGTKSSLDAIQILGGNGYINDYPTGKLVCRKLQQYNKGSPKNLMGIEFYGREYKQGELIT